jgi:hypothetical protein
MTPSPATARVLAESPSVRIKVQPLEFLVPASLASSSLAIPRSLFVFLPVDWLSKQFISYSFNKCSEMDKEK